jgi:hypothetical protein
MAHRVFLEMTHTKDLSDTEQKAQVANIHSELDAIDIGNVIVVQGSSSWAILVGDSSDVEEATAAIRETQFVQGMDTLTDDGAATKELDTQYMVAACDCQYP